MFRAVLLLTCCFRHFQVTGQWILNKTTTQHNNYICIKDLIQCVFFHIFHFSLGVMNSRVAGVNIKVKSVVHIKSSQIQYWTHSSEPYHYRFQAYAFKNKKLQTENQICTMSIFVSFYFSVNSSRVGELCRKFIQPRLSAVHKLSFPHRAYKIQTGNDVCFTCLHFVKWWLCFVLSLFLRYFLFFVNWMTMCIWCRK